jgi:hypothetical protein
LSYTIDASLEGPFAKAAAAIAREKQRRIVIAQVLNVRGGVDSRSGAGRCACPILMGRGSGNGKEILAESPQAGM